MTTPRHPLVVFDVNETLSDLRPLRTRLERAGAPGHLLPTWFAGVLRDGFALTASGAFAGFSPVARDVLRGLLADLEGWDGDAESVAEHVVSGFAELDVHPDVPDGVRALHGAGFRLMTMTNGSAAVTGALLSRAGLLDCFEALLDVSGPRRWKPAPEAYRYVTDRAGLRPDRAVLVAVHPWDVDGARRAGLAGAWLRRGSSVYPETMCAPTMTIRDLRELPDLLTRP